MFDAIVTIAVAVASISAPVAPAAQGECVQSVDGTSIVCSSTSSAGTTYDVEVIPATSLDACADGDWANCGTVTMELRACVTEDSDNCVWWAPERGNGAGRIFVAIDGGVIYF
jgi:hypothetical protein